MQYITYSELLDCYGLELAHDMLVAIEKSAKIKSNLIYMNEDARLQLALEALNYETIAA